MSYTSQEKTDQQRLQVLPITLKLYHKDTFIKAVEFTQDSIVIGRILSADLKLDDTQVSRLHAIIEQSENQKVYVFDLGSSNGTKLNHESITEAELQSGDQLQVGSYTLVTDIGSDPQDVMIEDPPLPKTKFEDEGALIPTVITDAHRSFQEEDQAGQTNEFISDSAAPDLRYPPKSTPPSDQLETRLSPTLISDKKSLLDKKVLEVIVMWNDSILDIRHYTVLDQLSIGTEPKNFLTFETDGLPPQFNLIEKIDNRYYLNILPIMTGEMRVGSEMKSLSEIQTTAPEIKTPKYNYYHLPITLNTKALIRIGPFAFFIQFVIPAPQYPINYWKHLDKFFLALLFLSLILHGLVIHLTPLPPEKTIEEKLREPDRFTRIILYSKPPSAPTIPALKAKQKKRARRQLQTKRKEARAQKISRKEQKQLGINKVIRNIGQLNEFKDIFSSDGIGKNLDKAIDTLSDNRPTTQDSTSKPKIRGIRGTGTSGTVPSSVDIATVDLPRNGDAQRAYNIKGDVAVLDVKKSAKVKVLKNDSTVTGSLSKEEVERVVQDNSARIEYCYEQQLMRNPNIYGKVEINWIIGSDGRVSEASIKSSTLKSEAAENCMIRAIRRLRFPKPRGQGNPIVEVNYPFVFLRQ